MRQFLLSLLFLAFILPSTTLVVMLVIPELPVVFGVEPGEPVGGWQALATVGLAIPLVFGALYLSGLLWLFCACHLFTRDEVERFAKAGPQSRLETWVFERFSR